MSTRNLIALAALVVLACGPGAMTPVTVPLQYKMMADAIEIPVMQACAGVRSVEVTDRRDEQQLGTRFLQATPSDRQPVTASGDVAAWARAAVEEGLRRARVNVGAADKAVLSITIEQIATEESVYRRAEYDARVIVLAELRRTPSSEPCWRERVDGFEENYGYAGSAENYQETLNHALDRAVIRMLNSTGFKEAVCSCPPARP